MSLEFEAQTLYHQRNWTRVAPVPSRELRQADRQCNLYCRQFSMGLCRRSSLDGAPGSARPLSDREPLIDEAAFKTPQRTPVRPKQSLPEPAP